MKQKKPTRIHIYMDTEINDYVKSVTHRRMLGSTQSEWYRRAAKDKMDRDLRK